MISEVSPGAAGEGEGMSQEDVCVSPFGHSAAPGGGKSPGRFVLVTAGHCCGPGAPVRGSGRGAVLPGSQHLASRGTTRCHCRSSPSQRIPLICKASENPIHSMVVSSKGKKCKGCSLSQII